ncbi:hypothetical protein EB118_18670 [bacterium]|nr:hypothetical protein [bacterium]NDD85105.1 hypothetical protein [bacterium]NDG32085.1 hypothetical protein [bacterium]
MNNLINKPRFGYLHNDSKVYIVTKRSKKYPMCFSKCKFFTVPIILEHAKEYHNSIIGYTNPTYINNGDDGEVECWTCKDVMHVADVLSMPVSIIMDSDASGTSTIFYKPKRRKK